MVDVVNHWDDLVEINDLAEEVRNPRPGEITDEVLDYPVYCGGLRFRQLTIAARLWLRDTALPALDDDPGMTALAIAYAMVYRSECIELSDARAIRKRVRRFARRELRRVTEEQLLNVFSHFGMREEGDEGADEIAAFDEWWDDHIVHNFQPPPPGGNQGDARAAWLAAQKPRPADGQDEDEYGTLIALLVREYGAEPHYWIYQAPREMVEACARDIVVKAHLEADAAERAQAKAMAGSGKARAPDPHSPIMQAQMRLNTRLQAFRRKVLAGG